MGNETSNESKNGRIKFKAEPTRHFPRYKIPAFIEIDGNRYKVKDWSIEGCAIEGLPDEYLEKKWAKGDFIVPFDTFDAVIKGVSVEFLRKNAGGDVGCRFTELRADHIALLQNIIESYLEGTIINVNELINTIKREDLKEALEVRQPKPSRGNEFAEKIRKLFIVSLFIIVLGTLVLFILYALYNRVYLVRAVSSFYDAPLRIVRTPASGFFTFKKPVNIGDFVKKREMLGFVNVPGRVSFIVPTAVNGRVIKVYVYDNDAVKEGDPLIAVLPEGCRVYVLANILHKDLDRVKIGQVARIIRFNGEIISGKITDIKATPSLAVLHSTSPMPSYSLAWNYDRVVISIPQKRCSIEDIGKSVKVEIDLSPPLLKPLFRIFERY